MGAGADEVGDDAAVIRSMNRAMAARLVSHRPASFAASSLTIDPSGNRCPRQTQRQTVAGFVRRAPRSAGVSRPASPIEIPSPATISVMMQDSASDIDCPSQGNL